MGRPLFTENASGLDHRQLRWRRKLRTFTPYRDAYCYSFAEPYDHPDRHTAA